MPQPQTVPYGKRRITVIGEIKLRGRVYRTLEEIRHDGRTRYWVHDPRAGPRGDFRQILVLPNGNTSPKHIAVLQLSQGNSNLPTIVDSARQGEEIWLVTNWVRGKDVRTYLREARSGKRKWPSPLEVIKLYRGLAHGLTQMHHRRRIYHGDIKPANLVLANEPNRLVMIDFGTAWMAERTTYRNPGDGTSRYYSAPELLNNGLSVLDGRSDQFSATVVAYEMLTGVRPYGEIGGEAGLPENRAIYEPLYRPPSQLSPMRRTVPQRIWRLVDDVIARGLKLDANDRFPSRQPWLEALEDLHCEMRRKGQFGRVESAALRFIGWFGDHLYRRDTQ